MYMCVQVEVAEKLVVRVWKKVLAHPGKPCSFLKPWLTQLPDLKKKNGKKEKKIQQCYGRKNRQLENK